VLEPIFEADFFPCSYGFRPRRRAHDAIAEVHHFTSRTYEWIVEGDIKACFDEISHSALMDRVRKRVGDRRVLTRRAHCGRSDRPDGSSYVPGATGGTGVSPRLLWLPSGTVGVGRGGSLPGAVLAKRLGDRS
jgi:hypothetical protein